MITGWTEQTIELAPSIWVRARIYQAAPAQRAAPLVLYLHGGAFTDGSLEASELVPTLLAEAGATVVSAGYPLAPQHPFPEALQTAHRALTWLHAHRRRWGSKQTPIFVAGDEAGGNLAAALALMARDQHGPPVAGQILLSPMLDPCLGTCSMREADAGQVGCKWADGWHQYLGSADKAAHPYASPLGSSRLTGLPPALVLTAQDDLLRDESLRYARRLRESGVSVQEHVLPGPTGWPDALGSRADTREGWAAALRGCFAEFFARTTAALRFHPSLRPVQA